jgi:hypothetical protein
MNLKFLTIVISTFLVFSNIVLAVPSPPNWFFGSVNINGIPAPDGTTVTARINGIVVASTTTIGGKYGYEPSFYVPDTEPSTRPGATISFFVNGVNTGQTSIFLTSGVTKLDLSVTIETPSGGGAPGGGGAPSGGGSTPSTETTTEEGTTQEQGCQERWTCSDWGACENGIQTRTCEDINNCGTSNNEPFSSQPCATVGEEAESSAGPAGFFLFSPTNLIIGSVVGVIVAIIIILFLKMRKPKTVVHMVKV